MKGKQKRRVLALFMSLLMVIGLIPANFSLTTVKAADITYTFDASKESAVTGVTVSTAIAGGISFAEGYFQLVGDGSKRGNSASTYSLELAKNAGSKLQFTTANNATVVVSAGSTGGTNTSTVALMNGGNKVVEKAGVVSVTGTAAVSFTYENLPAGTYTVSNSPDDSTRGVRIYSVIVTETPAATNDALTVSNPVITEKNSSTWTLGWDESAVSGSPSAKLSYSVDGGASVSLGTVAAGTKTFDVDMKAMKTGSYVFTVAGTDSANIVSSAPKSWTQARADWTSVTNPTATVSQNGANIDVAWNMNISVDGADSLDVVLMNGTNVVGTKTVSAASTSGIATFTSIVTSGIYTVDLIAKRSGETDKTVSGASSVLYALALTKPTVNSATGDGNGSVAFTWDSVKEADSYTVWYKEDGISTYTKAAEGLKDTSYTVNGLSVGKKYNFQIEAIRLYPSASSVYDYDKTLSSQVERVWNKEYIGTQAGTNASTGYINENVNGTVSMYAPAGKLASSNDGFSFYYTKVNSATENFVFKATMTLDAFAGDNQAGAGLMVTDTVGLKGQEDLCCAMNYLLAGISKTEWTDATTGIKTTYPCGPSFRKVLGCTDPSGVITTGRTVYQDAAFNKNLTADQVVTPTNFNKTENGCQKVYNLTLTKDNNGYHATLEGSDGTLHSYDPSKLLKQDKDNVYVGFAVSRNVTATFSNISFESRNPANDPAKDESTWDKDYTPQNLFVFAGDTTSQANYNYRYYGNWAGNVTLKDDSGNTLFSKDVAAYETISYDMVLTNKSTKLTTIITPDPSKVLLASYDPVVIEKTVTMNKIGKEGETLIVSPTGTSQGTGTNAKPLDIYTAVKYAQPGQTILLKDGTYDVAKDIIIPYSVSGTAGKMITLMAENPGKVILDGTNGTGATGSLLQINGDYWNVYGLEICNSAPGKKGVGISGNNNIMELCNIHNNGTTGLQISRAGGEPREWWPKNNLVKNCDSYNNCDPGLNDADGFAAKLTVGSGNKFYGCVAHNNIDDGWDLYAKNEFGQGSIEPVVVENCVAYNNGIVPGITGTGEGNGFKLGGEGLPGAHQLINSVSYNNLGKGITSNNGPDCQVINCTTFNNSLLYGTGSSTKGSPNLGLAPLSGTKYSGTTNYVLQNTISYTNFTNAQADQITLLGQSTLESTNNYLVKSSGSGFESTNSVGAKVNADWFTNLDTSVVPTRNSNGTIDMHGLLVLTAKAPVGVGAVIKTDGAAVSVKPAIPPITGNNSHTVIFITLSIMSGAALVGLYFYDKKRRTMSK